jgi:hypothetical protein
MALMLDSYLPHLGHLLIHQGRYFHLLNRLTLLRFRSGRAQHSVTPPMPRLPDSKSSPIISLDPEFQNDCVEHSKQKSLNSMSERKSSTSVQLRTGTMVVCS